ncbi:MAG TPA: response regulator transcription factor, partial [Methylothermaceae bacterium]|nr:response regulator transcription factor [Methylothermaceae bacterium]
MVSVWGFSACGSGWSPSTVPSGSTAGRDRERGWSWNCRYRRLPTMIRLLLVDDHPVVCSGYRRYLENMADIQVAGEAGCGAEGYRLFAELRPDVTVVDISLPDMSGLEVVRRIRQRDPEARLLVFTIHENALMMERAMQAGAIGYLGKHHGPALMVEAVRQVAGGELFLDPDLRTGPEKIPASPLKRLTPREFE